MQRLPRCLNTSKSSRRQFEWLDNGSRFVHALEDYCPTPIRVVLQNNVIDDKLRLRKLIRVFDGLSLRIPNSARGRSRLLRTHVMLPALILRTNGNRRAKNHQRGG